MTVLLARREIILTPSVRRFAPVAVPIAAQTASIALRLTRPTTLAPLAWGVLDRLRTRIVVEIDGEFYVCEGQATGGIRAIPLFGREVAEYRLVYTPTNGYFGAREGLPKRLGELSRTRYVAHVELDRLDGSIATDILVESVEAPAPPVPFRGSVAFDAVTDAQETAGDGTLSLSHTATNSDPGGFAGVGATADTPGSTSVNYGGTGMTERWDLQWGALFTNAGYTLAGLASGAQTVTSTLADAQSYEHGLSVLSMTGVDQTTPVGTAATGSGTTSPASVTVGSVGADDIVVDHLMTQFIDPADHSAGADQTERSAENINGGAGIHVRTSTQPGTAGGVMSWTFSNQTWRLGAIAFKPAAAGGDPEGSLIGGKLLRGGLLMHGVLVR